MSTYVLRDYQVEGVERAIYGLTKYAKPFIIVEATGAGKSLMIAEICHRLNEPVLILQPNKEILQQNYQKLRSYGVTDVAMYSASVGTKEIAKYTYAMIGSIKSKPELFKHFKYVILDECHGLDPKKQSGMLTKFLKEIGCTRVCGLTATPYRIVQKYKTDERGDTFYTGTLSMINRIPPFFFKKIMHKTETQDLIDRGYLSPISYFVDRGVDLSELKLNTTGKDFTEESVAKFWNNDRLRRIAQAVHYADGHHKKSLIFCSSLKQAYSAKELVSALGISCEIVDGKTPMKERERIVEEYKAGKIKHLFNVGVFTTGFDVPELDCIIMARTTMSLALYYQMIGRGVRLDPDDANKVLCVYDLSGVVERLGRVETIRIVTEAGGFRDEVHTEYGRADEEVLFEWFVKKKPKFLKGAKS